MNNPGQHHVPNNTQFQKILLPGFSSPHLSLSFIFLCNNLFLRTWQLRRRDWLCHGQRWSLRRLVDVLCTYYEPHTLLLILKSDRVRCLTVMTKKESKSRDTRPVEGEWSVCIVAPAGTNGPGSDRQATSRPSPGGSGSLTPGPEWRQGGTLCVKEEQAEPGAATAASLRCGLRA